MNIKGILLLGLVLVGDLCHGGLHHGGRHGGLQCQCKLVMNSTTEPCTTDTDCNNGALYKHRCTQTMKDRAGIGAWYTLGSEDQQNTAGTCKDSKCRYPIGMKIENCGKYKTIAWKKNTPEGKTFYKNNIDKIRGSRYLNILVDKNPPEPPPEPTE